MGMHLTRTVRTVDFCSNPYADCPYNSHKSRRQNRNVKYDLLGYDNYTSRLSCLAFFIRDFSNEAFESIRSFSYADILTDIEILSPAFDCDKLNSSQDKRTRCTG